jgi:hypothetical protein
MFATTATTATTATMLKMSSEDIKERLETAKDHLNIANTRLDLARRTFEEYKDGPLALIYERLVVSEEVLVASEEQSVAALALVLEYARHNEQHFYLQTVLDNANDKYEDDKKRLALLDSSTSKKKMEITFGSINPQPPTEPISISGDKIIALTNAMQFPDEKFQIYFDAVKNNDLEFVKYLLAPRKIFPVNPPTKKEYETTFITAWISYGLLIFEKSLDICIEITRNAEMFRRIWISYQRDENTYDDESEIAFTEQYLKKAKAQGEACADIVKFLEKDLEELTAPSSDDE